MRYQPLLICISILLATSCGKKAEPLAPIPASAPRTSTESEPKSPAVIAMAREYPKNQLEFKNEKVLEIRRAPAQAATTAQAAEPPPLIVYNTDISPQLPRDKAVPNRPVLQAGLAATLRFAIGPKWNSSLIPDATPSSDILQSKEDIPLTVVMSCSFCEPHAESLKRMTYMPKQGHSNEIRLQFTPQRLPDGSTYTDKLQLGIINDETGLEYDRLVIDVVVSGTPASPATTAPHIATLFAPSRGVTDSNWSPDVLLYATEEMGRNISISIEPVSDEMKSRLNLALDAQGQRRKFRSGIEDAKLVEAMTTSAYGVMSAVSMQGQLLKHLSASGTDAVVSPESQQSLLLTDTESENVAGVIADIGQRLYRHLFVDTPDTDLRKLIMQLELVSAEPRDRPLRLKIITNQISVPWQYLHPVGPNVNAEKFWGLRFSLSVFRVNTGARGKGMASEMQQARKVVFARYGSSSDATVPLAKEQELQLRKLPVKDTDLVEVDNGTDLLANLKQRRKEISAIVAFLHATSSATDSEPQLVFNDGDRVTSDRLELLLNKEPIEEQESTKYLVGEPLVILNACETGPSVNLPHVSLENVMFQLGAQGVVVTEVSVWIHLGHDVATRLIRRLGKGEAISDALTAVRRELYSEKKNPLGLLYAYYGDPAATLRR